MCLCSESVAILWGSLSPSLPGRGGLSEGESIQGGQAGDWTDQM